MSDLDIQKLAEAIHAEFAIGYFVDYEHEKTDVATIAAFIKKVIPPQQAQEHWPCV
jgi:hypothetical protein